MTRSFSNTRACGLATFRLGLLALFLRVGVYASSESELMPLGSVGRCLLQSSGDMQHPTHNFMAAQQHGLEELEEPGSEELQERGRTQQSSMRGAARASVTEKKAPQALSKAHSETAATNQRNSSQPRPTKSSALGVAARSSSGNEENRKAQTSFQAPSKKETAGRVSNSSEHRRSSSSAAAALPHRLQQLFRSRSFGAAASGNAKKAGKGNHVKQPLTYYNFMAGEQHSPVTHHKSTRGEASVPRRLVEPSLQTGDKVQNLPKVHPRTSPATAGSVKVVAKAQPEFSAMATAGHNPVGPHANSTPSFAQFLKTVGIAARSVLGDQKRQGKENIKRRTSHDASISPANRQVVVSPRSRFIMEKLAGGHKSDSRMRKLDQAFVLKLLQGGSQSTFKGRRAARHGPPKAKKSILAVFKR